MTKKQLEITTKHKGTESLGSPVTKNESKLSHVNSKKDLQTKHDCPYKFDENKLGNNLISEFSAENSELELVKSNGNNLEMVN